ncbi:hypothetical protein M271_25815 [Streptomyces rapamycinicus NRRL 5491]|uniref:Uncharacterized protein n=1 Tax=Streptomyces rapamycinicus TaxID=1226757 RepID=A0ABR6LPH4_9ACTN|nr:hypothetical protein M271_25815 [Streptomyces rapamycinicus NRRL 5491]MBB4784253.1 hypothetical protein [Streptomyces rapamycinicus]
MSRELVARYGQIDVLVYAHVWGVNAFAASAWHLRRSGVGGMFDAYAVGFDGVWAIAIPVGEG